MLFVLEWHQLHRMKPARILEHGAIDSGDDPAARTMPRFENPLSLGMRRGAGQRAPSRHTTRNLLDDQSLTP